jgi:site-specific recombinase XerC
LRPVQFEITEQTRAAVSDWIKRTKNLRAVQLLLGHAKLEFTVRYLGIEVDDALEMAEETGI